VTRSRDHRADEAAKLPGRAGSYEEALPIAHLRPHFLCAWVNAVADDHRGPIAIVPDGCVDLLWRDSRFLIVGPDATAAFPDLKAGDRILGLRFKPGVACRWLNLPMTELLGREVEMADIWGRKARFIAERLACAAADKERLILLQRLLLDLPAAREAPPRDAALIFGLTGANVAEQQGGLAQIRDALGLSERSLRRRCHDAFGYGPKRLHRILRLQAFMGLVRRHEALGLGNLALAAGYADQAHLNREVRALCDMTAGEFALQLA
jgi:AraC-like DNA-binding protein